MTLCVPVPVGDSLGETEYVGVAVDVVLGELVEVNVPVNVIDAEGVPLGDSETEGLGEMVQVNVDVHVEVAVPEVLGVGVDVGALQLPNT